MLQGVSAGVNSNPGEPRRWNRLFGGHHPHDEFLLNHSDSVQLRAGILALRSDKTSKPKQEKYHEYLSQSLFVY